MTRNEFDFLESMIQRRFKSFKSLSPGDAERFRSMSQMGYVEAFPSGAFNVTRDGWDAYQQYLRAKSDIIQASAEKQADINRSIRALRAQEHAAASLDDLAAELASLRCGLEKTADELREYKSQQAEQRSTDIAQAEFDKKKALRHQYLVAAFTAACTLFVEHIVDVVEFAKLAFNAIGSLFH